MSISNPHSVKALLALACMTAASLTTTAHAQPLTDSFTYQGELSDGGVPANGLYDITFAVYDAPAGGTVIGSATTVLNVQVTDGRFQTFVDFGFAGFVFRSDQTRWVELSVTEAGQPGSTTLTPRQRIAPTPVSTYALNSKFAQTSGTTLQNAYDNGNTIVAGIGGLNILANATLGNRALLRLGIGGIENGEGKLELYANNGPLVQSLGTDSFSGAGEHIIYQSDGEIANFAGASFAGGGFFNVFRSPGSSGMTFEGFNNESRVSFFGQDNSIFFRTGSSTGNGTVSLPAGAIDSAELFNEVGGAASQNTAGVNLTPEGATVDIIDSVTITAPAPGYVLVLGSLEATIGVTQGLGNTNANFGVSNFSNALPNNGDVELRYPTNTPTGDYDLPITLHGFFPVSEGSQTFYILGDQNSTVGTFTAFDTQLTAIYIPTLYGTPTIQSTTNLAGNLPTNLPDELTPTRGSLTEYEVLLKRNAALEANDERMQKELDEINAKMHILLEQAQRDHNKRTQK